MSEQTPEVVETSQPITSVEPQDPPIKARSSVLAKLNFVLILIILAAMSAAGWYAYQHNQILIRYIEGLTLQQASIQADVIAQNSQYSKQGSQLQQAQEQLRQELAHTNEALARIPTAGRADWLLAEAEYLLRLANQRLQLENDWNSALSMLQAADNVLVEAKNPRMNAVRALLAEEIITLRKAPSLDIQGAVLRLQALQKELPQLAWLPNQLKLENTNAEPMTSENQELAWYQIFWAKVTHTLSGLVRIRVQQDSSLQPLSPDQQYYLEQNMFLMLEQAQAALLREEPALYQHSLQRVSEWVSTYMVAQDASTEAVLQSLGELLEWPVAPERPDISDSLLKLQSLLEQQQRSSVNSLEEAE